MAPEHTNGVELLQAAVELLARDARTGTVEVRGSSMLPSHDSIGRSLVSEPC